MVDVVVPDGLTERAAGLALSDRPGVLGIVGAPGAGKSTLAEALLTALRARLGVDTVAHIPMDGYHLADATLTHLGLLDRKGAPETFDGWGYAAMLERVGSVRRPGEIIYVPGFERDLEQPIAAALAVHPSSRLVVTEGNYLLLPDPAWEAAADACDEIWFVEVPEDVRRERLLNRHVEFGKSQEAAQAWVKEVDQPNADLVAATRGRATIVVTLD